MDKNKKTEFDGSTEYTDIVRFPLKLFVDAIVFEPSASIDVVRSSYELHLTPYEMKKFHDWLGEKRDSRDSERFRGIMEQIQRSLDNSKRIEKLIADMDNLGGNFRELQKKSNLFDIVNGLGVAIAAAVGWNR